MILGHIFWQRTVCAGVRTLIIFRFVADAGSIKTSKKETYMNKASKVGTRSKPVKKTAAKPAKKRTKPLRAVRLPVADENGWKPEVVLLAEVEVLAATALKRIKASRKLPPDEKAWRLADVAETLEMARGWGALSKDGALWLKHAHRPPQPVDMEAIKAVLM